MNMCELALNLDRTASLQNFTESLRDMGLFRNCLNCSEWQKNYTTKEQRCGKYLVLPPPEVIVVGCPQHSDFIPF